MSAVQAVHVPGGAFSTAQLLRSLPDAVRKLNPRGMVKNPVMFVVLVGAVGCTVSSINDPSLFGWLVTAWLWLTVIFANLAEAVAEGRGRGRLPRCVRPALTQSPNDSLRTARKSFLPLSFTSETGSPSSQVR